jgi:hypothetical protein
MTPNSIRKYITHLVFCQLFSKYKDYYGHKIFFTDGKLECGPTCFKIGYLAALWRLAPEWGTSPLLPVLYNCHLTIVSFFMF